MSVAPVVRSARARRSMPRRPRPPPWRKACPTAARPPPALCALAHGTPRRSPASSCVFSPDPVTTPGHPVPGGCVRGGRQTESRPRDDPGVPRPRGMRARGAPGRTAPSPARGDHGQHSHPQRPALLPRRPRGTPWRTCRPHRPPSPPRTPHPVADVLTLELMPCLTRGRVGALRGRHTTTTY